MVSTSPSVLVLLALLLLVFLGAGISFGFIQTILIVAIGASGAMFCAFLFVASSTDAH